MRGRTAKSLGRVWFAHFFITSRLRRYFSADSREKVASDTSNRGNTAPGTSNRAFQARCARDLRCQAR